MSFVRSKQNYFTESYGTTIPNGGFGYLPERPFRLLLPGVEIIMETAAWSILEHHDLTQPLMSADLRLRYIILRKKIVICIRVYSLYQIGSHFELLAGSWLYLDPLSSGGKIAFINSEVST